MSLVTVRSTSRISNIALAGALDERRSPSDREKFMRASEQVWRQAINTLLDAIESREAFAGADLNTLADLEREQIAESKTIIFLTKRSIIK